MFQTADWKNPHVGGLLTQVIVKEEAQLSRKPNSSHTVQHIWDSRAIDQRASDWKDRKDLRARKEPNGQLQLAMPAARPQQDQSRRQMLHQRRICENLSALKRSADGDANQFASFTPEFYGKLHPTYGVGETYATNTSSQIIGLGNDFLGIKTSRYGRDDTLKPDFMSGRNTADRAMVEIANKRLDAQPAPNPLLPWEKSKLRHQAAETPASYPFAHRSSNSAFCVRPNDIPVQGSRYNARPAGVSSTRPW